MDIVMKDDKPSLGEAAAALAAEKIQAALASRGEANIILATP